MKFSIGDKVVHYGRTGIVLNTDPATRKYMVDFSDTNDPTNLENLCLETVYESELTKIEEAPTT